MILLTLLFCWIYLTIVKTKVRSLFIHKIFALSKDGYEAEISRLQSKRNLFKFIKTYFVRETNFVPHPEEFWWKQSTYNKRKDIEESFQQFILNNAPQQEQEDFAYEGIFDKNNENDKSPMMGIGNRVDNYFKSAMNRSNMVLDEYRMLKNSSNGVINNEEISEQSRSPNSANYRAFGRNIAAKGKFYE